MIHRVTFKTNRRALLLRVAAAYVAARTSARAQTPAGGFPAFPELAPLPDIAERDGGALNVVASTGIVGDLARQIGGARVNVETILPANADPHTFEPAPQDVGLVDGADLVFVHGLGLDAWTETIIENAGDGLKVVTVTDGITTTGFDGHEHDHGDEESDEDHEHEHDHDVDPHVWFDPTRTAQMVANIAAALSEIDPDGAGEYATRLSAYQTQLTELDGQIFERIALIPEDRRVIVTNHEALGYYADRYGLEIVGTIIPGMSVDAEPSAQDIAELLQIVAEHNVTAIFTENTINPALAEELASQAGIDVVASLFTDSLGDAESGADTYIGLMRYDTRVIVEALIGS